MSLMVSVSGIRGIVGESLTPPVVMRYTRGFVKAAEKKQGVFLIGRDTRDSGPSIERVVEATITSLGHDVVNIGIAVTPTVLYCTRNLGCCGGIAITASHNGPEWNALKFCSGRGLFIEGPEVEKIERFAAADELSGSWTGHDRIGSVAGRTDAGRMHIDAVTKSIDTERIKEKGFVVAIDPVGGSGTAITREFLERLGCTVVGIHESPQTDFPRGPEPTPQNLTDLCVLVKNSKADIGFAQDPDGDRLSVVSELGKAIGEEYTLVLAGESYLRHTSTDIVCNLSTSMMADDLAHRFGVRVFRTKIGEINVTRGILEKKASYGGEGNGGVIATGINPCRDSIVGMGLILQLLAEVGEPLSKIVGAWPSYHMDKKKIALEPQDTSIESRQARSKELYAHLFNGCKKYFDTHEEDTLDGIKIYNKQEWIHLRLSNTEPVIRIMAESPSAVRTKKLMAMGTALAQSI
ncbi:MAG: phosphoglucosamine mutase [Spirochaetes bacterium]|nr:phosphoglucosamine mutase [Spirochaetota bacterium]